MTSQKGDICETIVIDDEGDTDTNRGEEKNPTDFIEWGLNGNKNSTKNVDFPIASLSRSKTKAAVGPFNPGRIDVTDAFQNGRFAVHHNPGKHYVVFALCSGKFSFLCESVLMHLETKASSSLGHYLISYIFGCESSL